MILPDLTLRIDSDFFGLSVEFIDFLHVFTIYLYFFDAATH